MNDTIGRQRRLATVSLMVRDYDEAANWYVDALGFSRVDDIDMGGGKRWVTISAGQGAQILLAKADGELQQAAVGNQTGGRVAFFLETDDFARDHAAMLAKGVEFKEELRHEPYGTVAVFADLYGNQWDLIERR